MLFLLFSLTRGAGAYWSEPFEAAPSARAGDKDAVYASLAWSVVWCEGLQVAHADDLDVGDIYIEPPEPAELTNEDSADEDGGGLVDNLSANQLRAAAEISIYQQDNTDDNEIISEALEEPKEEPQPVNSVVKFYNCNIS
ncbi:hypothetical protein JTB14_032109 [Gonioctena quinquepunctata]|nr:hypothetical protein JTB14_032109 [Gonioctena quinquepunctata]